MKKIEARENEFITQFVEMLEYSFPKPLGFKVDYYLGEDENDTKGLYFALHSLQFGLLFSRFQKMEPFQVIYDIEEEFINKVINEFVLAGVTVLNVEAFKSQADKRFEAELKDVSFKNTIPRKLLFTN